MIIAALLPVAWGATGAMPAPRTFSQSDNGQTAVMGTGEAFKVVLPENPGTGYSWNMTVSGGLKMTGDRYIALAQQIPGRGGEREWTMQAVKPGRQKITGIYKRPWEPVYGNETTFQLDLAVTR